MGLKNDLFSAAGRLGDMLRVMPPLMRPKAPDVSIAERIDLLEERQARGDELRSLQGHPYWKTFAAELSAREAVLLDLLRHAPLKDVVRLQASLAELQLILQIVPEGIALGDAARDELCNGENAHE